MSASVEHIISDSLRWIRNRPPCYPKLKDVLDMGWIFAAVVLLLAVYVPKFRVVVGWLTGVCVLLGLGVWAYCEWSESRAKTLIRPSEVLLEDMRLRRSGNGWVLSGRLRNDSPQHTLSRVGIDVLIKDCAVIEPPVKIDNPEEALRQLHDKLLANDSGSGSKSGAKFDDPEKALRQIEKELLGAPPENYSSSSKCDIVGQKEVGIALDVPSGQVRNLEEDIYFPAGTQVQRTMDWQFRLLETTGK